MKRRGSIIQKAKRYHVHSSHLLREKIYQFIASITAPKTRNMVLG
jgi:hypothetical protein